MTKERKNSDSPSGDTRLFSKYLVVYGPEEEKTGIKGIRKDAPKEAIDAFIDWYRNNNRYDNGRIRPLSDAMVRKLLVEPDGQ